jgi:hypothetical protein
MNCPIHNVAVAENSEARGRSAWPLVARGATYLAIRIGRRGVFLGPGA